MRGYAEPVNILTGQALNVNGKTTISDALPVGEGWYSAIFHVNLVIVIGTGAGPIAEGELNIVKNILLRTDRGEILANVPGRALYKMAHLLQAEPTTKDAIAAASATYTASLPVYFADPRGLMDRDEDTVLDTKRYSALTLEVTLGGLTDLYTAPGTATLTANLDVEVFRTKGLLPKRAEPVAHVTYDIRPPVDAFTNTLIFLERSQDLAIKRLFVHSGTAGVAGVPWSGVNSDAIQNITQIKDQSGFISKDRIHKQVQRENVGWFGVSGGVVVGVECYDFVRDRSVQSALVTAGKPLLQYQWTNQGGVAANSIVTATMQGIRSLK